MTAAMTYTRTSGPFSHAIAEVSLARAILPEGTTPTRMMMSGTIRDWLHYCALRMGNGTQPEHQQIAEAIWQILSAEIPTIAQAWEARA